MLTIRDPVSDFRLVMCSRRALTDAVSSHCVTQTEVIRELNRSRRSLCQLSSLDEAEL